MIILNSYYQEQLVRNDNFVQVDERNAFKYHSLVICDKYYFIKWGKDKYQLSKIILNNVEN
ncbi:hypothetical protein SMM_0046 [Spiroplasma mirum ATCC 29335]|nr:hypothetical protein SMM_0046 [Spiroplasma mirum ATCC 29335]